MTKESLLIWSWLNVLTKKRYDYLIQEFGDLDSALESLSEQLLQKLGCREETVFRVLNRREEFDPSWYEKELEKRNITLISIEDVLYPDALNQIPDAPVFLSFKGNIDILNEPCIALVGTREMSSYGKRIVEGFVPTLVSSGVVTISGLALGIDAEVAKETMRTSGKTVAVLGHGLGAMYPKSNQKLSEEIISNGGLLLTEFPLDSTPDKYTFPARNRIIAGLCLGTIVLEAGEKSGSLITAELALEYNKEVFAVPGQIFDPNFAGSNSFISKGQAKSVSSPEEVLQEIGIVGSDVAVHRDAPTEFNPEDEQEAALYKSLTTMPQSVTDIVKKSALNAAIVNATLTMLEIEGRAKNMGEGMWVRR